MDSYVPPPPPTPSAQTPLMGPAGGWTKASVMGALLKGARLPLPPGLCFHVHSAPPRPPPPKFLQRGKMKFFGTETFHAIFGTQTSHPQSPPIPPPPDVYGGDIQSIVTDH